MLVGGIGVAVGVGIGVLVGGTGVGVAVGDGVLVGGTGVAVDIGVGVAVGAGVGVLVGVGVTVGRGSGATAGGSSRVTVGVGGTGSSSQATAAVATPTANRHAQRMDGGLDAALAGLVMLCLGNPSSVHCPMRAANRPDGTAAGNGVTRIRWNVVR